MMEWRVLAMTHGLITLRRDDAVLVIEVSRVDVTDPDLEGAISRLAPLLTFGECTRNGAVSERIASHAGERVVVGRLARGVTSVSYIVTSQEPIEVAEVIATLRSRPTLAVRSLRRVNTMTVVSARLRSVAWRSSSHQNRSSLL